ncbi:Hypothetical predicted protein [Pelobates cultripes]|uniref:Uncharacterized protein n=1 Tax=Pelobates cultripes TaxID=61616 RepID=A0AAD1WLY7_PELCU|nr:Hypothetical predicted protein [Pelobates cultripes]
MSAEPKCKPGRKAQTRRSAPKWRTARNNEDKQRRIHQVLQGTPNGRASWRTTQAPTTGQQHTLSGNKHRQVLASRKTKGGKRGKSPRAPVAMNHAILPHEPSQTAAAQKLQPQTSTSETADPTTQGDTPHRDPRQPLHREDRGLHRKYLHHEPQKQASRSAQGSEKSITGLCYRVPCGLICPLTRLGTGKQWTLFLDSKVDTKTLLLSCTH